jgi:ankyrin repeat protein
VVQYLLENGAKVDLKNKKGQTPLAITAIPVRGENGQTVADTNRRSAQKTAGLIQSGAVP